MRQEARLEISEGPDWYGSRTVHIPLGECADQDLH